MKIGERLFTKMLMREHRSINARVNSEATPKAVSNHTQFGDCIPHRSEGQRADPVQGLGIRGTL